MAINFKSLGTKLATKAVPKPVVQQKVPTRTTVAPVRTTTVAPTFNNPYTAALTYSMPKQAAPVAAPATQSLAQNIANMVGAQNVYKGPLFGEVLPFEQAWGKMLPAATEEANAQINPFLQRDLRNQLNSYNLGLANTGAWRFGFGGRGSMEAETERNRKAQVLDLLNQRQSGFKQLFYDPTEQAFQRAIELGQTPTAPNINTMPTWAEFNAKYNQNANAVPGTNMVPALHQTMGAGGYSI